MVSGAGEGTSHGLCWEQAAPSLPTEEVSVLIGKPRERSLEGPKMWCRRSTDRADLRNEPRSCCWTIPAPTHQRHTRGDIQENQGHRGDHTSATFPPTQQELLQAAHKHLGCAEGEHHMRAKLCPSLLCSPLVQLGLRQDGAAAEPRWSQVDSILLGGRGTSSKPTL